MADDRAPACPPSWSPRRGDLLPAPGAAMWSLPPTCASIIAQGCGPAGDAPLLLCPWSCSCTPSGGCIFSARLVVEVSVPPSARRAAACSFELRLPVKSLLWFVPEPTMTTLFGVVHPCWGHGPGDAPLVSCQLCCGSERKLCDGGACGRRFSLLKARRGTSHCLSRGGSMLVAGFKRLSEPGRRGWLCGAHRRFLVCLGTVRPFVYADGTSVPSRRFAAHGLFDHALDTGGVMALCGLGCVSVRLR
jgi:hypothetical protein